MKITRITVSVIVALNIASAARAQETLKGEVVAIDRASKKISIKLGGTVAPSDTTAPTPFKIQDARMFDAVKLGDKVLFTAERERRNWGVWVQNWVQEINQKKPRN
jgi:Cu/Ag efflux protein CusF